MAFKQPRVPEYHTSVGVEAYIRTLILFLKDFCQEVWRACTTKEILGRVYPVGSVFLSANETNPGICFGGKWERLETAFGEEAIAWKRVS